LRGERRRAEGMRGARKSAAKVKMMFDDNVKRKNR
jgi:hypothetical protein